MNSKESVMMTQREAAQMRDAIESLAHAAGDLEAYLMKYCPHDDVPPRGCHTCRYCQESFLNGQPETELD